MPKKSNEAQVAESCIAALKDAISDLEKIAKGRGTEERYHVVSSLLYETQDALRSIDPTWARIRASEAYRKQPKALGGPDAAVAALTDETGRGLFDG